LFSAIPFIGENIVTWLWGGFSVGNPTLNRFYSLHFLLPFIIVALVVIHIWALHTHGSNNPTGVKLKDKDMINFHPYYTVKDFVGFGVYFLIFAYFIFYKPNLLGHPDNYTPANPLVTPAHIVPEWYFLPFYAILRAVPSKLGGVLMMFGSILILFFMPWLDKSPVRSSNYRPLYKWAYWVFLIDCLILGYVGGKPAEEPYLTISRVAASYYFFHFLILVPFIAKIEKPLPLPVPDEQAE
jgi:ubiquinol-cytochrome c reductase cytochrome b subunit